MAAGDEVDDLNAEAQCPGGEDQKESARRDGSSGQKVEDDDIEARAVEALAMDLVAHGGSRLGWRSGTLADEDVEAQGFQMRSSARGIFWQNLETARDSVKFSTFIVKTFYGQFI
jgi:hypothetical protein